MVRMIEAAAERGMEPGAAPVDLPALSRAHARMTRGVRMAALLHKRLVQDHRRLTSWAELEARQAREAAEAAAKEAEVRADPAYGHKARVEAIVGRVIRAETDNHDRIGRLIRETGERLDDDDIYGDVATRPVGELVALICRDLGLKPDWGRLGEEAWAMAEAEDGDPRSPFHATSPAQSGRGGPSAEEPMVERGGDRRTLAAAWFGDSS